MTQQSVSRSGGSASDRKDAVTAKTPPQRTSPNLPGVEPRIDKTRDTQEAIIEDAGDMDGSDRDLVHGDGGTIDLPTKPGDLSKDD